MRRPIRRAFPLVLAFVVVLSGCSFALVKAPATSEPEPATWPRCTEHYFWQVVDGAVALLALYGVGYFVAQDDEWSSVGAIAQGGLAAGFGASAVLGLGKTSRCRSARRAYERAAEQGR